MEKFYVCDAADCDDVVRIINMDQNAQLYGVDTVESGIRNIQIKRITATLNGEYPNSCVVGHRVNDELVGFSVMYTWTGLPAWSILISYTAYDYLETEKLAHSYKNIIMVMMDRAESQGIYNYYFVAKYATNIRADGCRFPNHSRGDLFPRYDFYDDEIIPPYTNSKYELYQQMIALVAGKNRRPLVVVHGSCKNEYRK